MTDHVNIGLSLFIIIFLVIIFSIIIIGYMIIGIITPIRDIEKNLDNIRSLILKKDGK